MLEFRSRQHPIRLKIFLPFLELRAVIDRPSANCGMDAFHRSGENMTRFIVLLGAGALLAFLTASSASAQAVKFDEYGNLSIDGSAFLSGSVAMDPLSGLSTLCYQLPWPTNAGDMFVLEPPTFGVTSDMIRFPGNNQVFVYSDDGQPPGPGNLAELPRAMWPPSQAVTGFVDEAADNSAFWDPGPAGIGGVGVGPYGSLTYTFISDGPIPEPAGGFLVVLSAGLILLGSSSVRWPPRAKARK